MSNTAFNDSDTINILLKQVAKNEGFCKYEIQTASGSLKGDGYTAKISSVCITGEDETNNNKTLNVILKSAPRSDALREALPLQDAFRRETHMYSTVFSALQTIPTEKNLPALYFAPKFYKAEEEPGNESIVLENLKASGFALHDSKLPMNENHVSLVLSRYAYFHALSFVMRDQNNNKFRKITEDLTDFLAGPIKNMFLNNVIHLSSKVKDFMKQKVEDSVITRYDKFVKEMSNYIDQIVNETDEYTAVLHCDCWCNNMLFQYYNNEDRTKPSDVRFVDFQASKVGSPVLDLAYFLYSCSSKELLNKLDYFMQLYHNNLRDFIIKCGSDPEKLYPYHVFQKHWKIYSKFGFIASFFALYIMFTEKNEAIDMANVAESKGDLLSALNYEIANMDAYNDRCTSIALHLYENDLF